LAELTQRKLRCCAIAAAESYGGTCPSMLSFLELLLWLSFLLWVLLWLLLWLLLLLLLLLLLVDVDHVLGLRCWSGAERVRAKGAG
jgi:hypothetical protein